MVLKILKRFRNRNQRTIHLLTTLHKVKEPNKLRLSNWRMKINPYSNHKDLKVAKTYTCRSRWPHIGHIKSREGMRKDKRFMRSLSAKMKVTITTMQVAKLNIVEVHRFTKRSASCKVCSHK